MDPSDFYSFDPNTQYRQTPQSSVGTIIASMVLVVLAVVFILWYTTKPTTTVSESITWGVQQTSATVGSQTTQTLSQSNICQQISDNFGTIPGNFKDGNGPDITATWNRNDCKTVPSTWTCQDISDAFGLSPANKTKPDTLGVYKTYIERGCTTSPQYTCQQLSDKYSIWPMNQKPLEALANISPKEADIVKHRFFNVDKCQSVPSTMSCQQMSNFFLMSPSDNGVAAASAPGMIGVFRSKGCTTKPIDCNTLADMYRDVMPTTESVDVAWTRWGNPCQAKSSPDPSFVYESGYIVQDTSKTDLFKGNNLVDCLNYCKTDKQCKAVVKTGSNCFARSYTSPISTSQSSEVHFKKI